MKTNERVLFQRHAEMCKVFSHATRLMILQALRDSEMSVQEIAEAVGEAMGTVSPHLLLMKRLRVLESRRDGTRILYRLANPRLLEAFDLIHDILLESLEREGKLAQALTKRSRP